MKNLAQIVEGKEEIAIMTIIMKWSMFGMAKTVYYFLPSMLVYRVQALRALRLLFKLEKQFAWSGVSV